MSVVAAMVPDVPAASRFFFSAQQRVDGVGEWMLYHSGSQVGHPRSGLRLMERVCVLLKSFTYAV